MAKRGNGEGSISKRRGKDGKAAGWMAQYWVDTPGGRRRRTIYGKTRPAVAARLAKAVSDRDGGVVYDDRGASVGEYLDSWLTGSVADTVRQKTWERYEINVRVHIKPALGRAKLKTLSANQLRALYRAKLDGDPGRGVKPLSPRTVNYIHVTIHKALKQAAADGVVPRNIASGVKAPRPGKPEITPLSREEARRLLDAAQESGERFYALYVVALHCGLRLGEMLGLRWEDLDLDAGTLRVRRTLSDTREKGMIFEKPKNGKGRAVKLSLRAVEALRSHRKRQNEEHLQSKRWEDHSLIFTNLIGKPKDGTALLKRSFRPLLERAGLPRSFRIHDLRHTCATILLMAGKHPKYVQELLGHANISITLDTYSHVIEGMDGGLDAAMDEALG